MTKYQIGDIVSLPEYGEGMIVGIQCFYLEDTAKSIKEIKLQTLEADYLIAYIDNGLIDEEWFPGGCL